VGNAAGTGEIKANWYTADSPNTGGGVEWVYTGDTTGSSTTPAPVSTWADLLVALNAVATYNASSNPEPYVIYVSDNITQTAVYTITNKNIILRKWDNSADAGSEPKPWNYDDPYITTELDPVDGKTGGTIAEGDAVSTPDLYDGESDFHLVSTVVLTNATSGQAGSAGHFVVGPGTSVLTLENITLDGDSYNSDGTTKYRGGIYSTANSFTFAGNVTGCHHFYNPAINIIGNVSFEMRGGVMYKNEHDVTNSGQLGACIGDDWSNGTNTNITVSGYSIFENNATGGYGTVISVRGRYVTVQDDVIMRNNRGAIGGAIHMGGSSGGVATLTIKDNVSLVNNTCFGIPKSGSAVYPGCGGALNISGHSIAGNGTISVTISDNVLIAENSADRGGGAIMLGNALGTATVSLNLLGGTIRDNVVRGTQRDLPGSPTASDRLSIGAGGAILSFAPQLISIPEKILIGDDEVDNPTSFSGNEAPFLALTGLAANGDTPETHRAVFLNDLNYKSHIVKDFSSENSAMFPAPYDNLYNGFDIGVPNTSQTAFGKLKIQTKVGETLGAGGSVTRSGSFSNVFPSGSVWIGLKVSNNASFTAVPDLGYRFTGWTRSSSVNLLATEWTAAMVSGAWNLSTNDANRNGATSTVNPAVINAMPAADITLTANFEKIPAAELSGFTALNWQEELDDGGNYTPPATTDIALTNGVTGTTATNISLSLSDFEKNGEVWGGTVPFTLTTGNPSITGGAGADTSWKVQPSGSLTEPGNYTATLTLSYQNGVDAAPIVSSVQISFALIDPDIPLFILGSIPFGTVVGSEYTVQTGDSYEGEDVERQSIKIQNLSASANLLDITLAGASADAFEIIPGNSSVAKWGTDQTWKIVPKAELAPGIYGATIRVGYVASDGGVTISSVAPVKFIVLRPAELSVNPSVYSFDEVETGYIPSLKDIVLTNNGEVSGIITGIAHKSGDEAFNTINTTGSSDIEVTAGNTNRSWQLSPKAGLGEGFYTEVLTVTYEHYVSGIAAPIIGTVDITATIPVGVSGYIVTVNYLDIDGSSGLRTSVPVFVESGTIYTPPTANKENFVAGSKNYGYYGYKLDDGSIINTTDLPTIANVTGTHTVNYYYGTQDVTVNAGLAGQAPSGSGNYAYGSTVNIGITSQTGYSFSSFTQTPAASVSISAPSTSARRTTASFAAGYGELSITPTFTPKTYTININTKGGSAIDSAVNQATGSHIVFAAPNARTGYTFSGYSKTDGGTAVSAYSNFTLDAGMIADLFANDTINVTTLFAVWTAKGGYSVKYETHGAEAILDKTGVLWNTTNLLPTPDPVLTGKTFKGWYAAESGGTPVTSTAAYSALASNDTDPFVTLHAQWRDGFTPVRNTHYEISALSTGSGGAAGWTNSAFTVTAKTGYKVSLTNTADGTWADSLSSTTAETAGDSIVFYVKRVGEATGSILQGEISVQGTENYKIDTTLPTAEVKYKNSGWRAFLNKVTFGLFFKADVVVKIQGVDEDSSTANSGVAKIEYLTTTQIFGLPAEAKAYGESAERTWIEDDDFNITSAEKGKLHLFVKVTDNAGNSAVYFDGLLVYIDSVQVSVSGTYTKTTLTDTSVDATLNGNTVKGIVNTTNSNLALTSSDFTVGNESITLDGDYLDTLAYGIYTFTVTYNPQDEDESSKEAGSDTAATTTFTVEILKKAQPALNITGISSTYIYGDSPVTLGTSGGGGNGSVSYEITNSSPSGVASLSSSTLSFDKPGTFKVKATKAGDNNYEPANVTSTTVTVAKALPSLTLSASGTGIFGADVNLAAEVIKRGVGNIPTGSIGFYVDGVLADTIALDGDGKATFAASNLSVVAHNFEVRYLGNIYYKSYGESSTADADPAASATASFTVGMAGQTIAIHDPADKTWGDSNITLSLDTLGSGSGAVTYSASPSGILSITDNTAVIVGVGSVTITADKAADLSYNAASSSVTITVYRADLTAFYVDALGSGITYGKTLADSALSGWTVKGVGTHASDTLAGSVTWNAPTVIPDVSTVSGTPPSYAVTFTPSGDDALHYNNLSGTADITVSKATPVLKTPLSSTQILPGNTLSDSVITGGTMAFDYGTQVDMVIPGAWTWNSPTKTGTAIGSGTNTEPATFTPTDEERFNSVSEDISVTVFSPKTVIKVPPIASPLVYGDKVSLSTLDDDLAVAEADDGSTSFAIPGEWTWSNGDDRASSVGTYTAEVTFTPEDVQADPHNPVSGGGYLPATADVTIIVVPADPKSCIAIPGKSVYGHSLSETDLSTYTVTGVFGETITGTLTWEDPDIIPSDEIGEVGIYTAKAVFTPLDEFAALYNVKTFDVNVKVIADTSALDAFAEDTVIPLLLILHEENYLPADISGLKSALASANLAREDEDSTQAEINSALESLQEAYDKLIHDHPVLKHSHDKNMGGVDKVTSFGQDIRVEIKGDFRDVDGFKLNGIVYSLAPSQAQANTLIVSDSAGKQIGTITKGSAVVNLPAAFSDRFENGTHKLEVSFSDVTSAGELGVADIVVNRTASSNTDIKAPKTGDEMNLGLWLAMGSIALMMLLGAVYVRRRVSL
jgi:hypothetical protein